MNFRLTLNTTQVDRTVRHFGAKAPSAIARALNRSIASGKTVMVRVISDDLHMKQADLRDKIRISEATPQRQVASLHASPKRIPVYDLGASPTLPPSRGRGRGVTWRGRGGRVREQNAFIARVGKGHLGVFRRVGALRKSRGAWSRNLPIKELFGPSIAHVFSQHVAVGMARAQEQLVKNLRHELRFALSTTA